MLFILFTALAALGSAPVTDWGPLQAASERYAFCVLNAARPKLTSGQSAEAIADAAMLSCSKEHDLQMVETRRALEPLAPSQAELDASVQRQSVQQQELLRSNLIAFIQKHRS
jgi:hypothetical protein